MGMKVPMAKAQLYIHVPWGGLPDSSCHTAEWDKDSRGQAVLVKGKGQGIWGSALPDWKDLFTPC